MAAGIAAVAAEVAAVVADVPAVAADVAAMAAKIAARKATPRPERLSAGMAGRCERKPELPNQESSLNSNGEL